jgi:hypothetical protein
VRTDERYYDQAELDYAIWAIAHEHAGATRAEMIMYSKEMGIPKRWALCSMRHSGDVVSAVRDRDRLTVYYAVCREQREAQLDAVVQYEARYNDTQLQEPQV